MSAAPAYPAPVNPNDLGRGPMVVAVTWVFTVVAMIAVSLWVVARRKQRVSLGWDVWIMIVALVIRVAFQCTITVSLKYGMGKHDKDLTPQQLVEILKYNWMALPPGVVTSALARVSITILLVRIFGVHKKFKWFLITTTTILCISSIILIPFTFCQVTPRSSLWNVLVPPEKRWNPNIWLYTAYFVQSVCTFSDLAYVLLPVAFIWKLQMPRKTQIGLILLMSVSLFTMAMSICKTIWISAAAHATQNTPDVQYTATYQVLFGVLEQDFVIIMGCIPSLRGFVNLEFQRLTSYGSKLTSFMKSKRRDTKASDSDHSTETYRSMQEVKNTKLGGSGDSYSAIVTSYPEDGSHDQLVMDNGQIRRTDQWSITHGDGVKTPLETV